MAKNDKRFVKICSQSTGFGEDIIILVDKNTGVNYMYFHYGSGGGLTPLLDREGRPIITSTFDLED